MDILYDCHITEWTQQSSMQVIGIFYRTSKWAKFVYDTLVKYFSEQGCLEKAYVHRCGCGEIILKNGTIYRIIKADEKALGRRFNTVYIEWSVDEDIINEVIIPAVTPKPSVYKVY